MLPRIKKNRSNACVQLSKDHARNISLRKLAYSVYGIRGRETNPSVTIKAQKYKEEANYEQQTRCSFAVYDCYLIFQDVYWSPEV